MFKIKICGITTPEDALLAADAGADAIGLNFCPESPRFVSPSQAAEISAAIPANVERVGIFAGADVMRIRDCVERARLTAVQLHDDPSDDQLRLVAALENVVPLIIQAFRLPNPKFTDYSYLTPVGEFLSAIENWYQCRFPMALLDAYRPGQLGGTGIALDWLQIQKDREATEGTNLILAGGLTQENVAEAIATARPDAVDVASGVESSPGKKDPSKVRDFVAAAKEAFARLKRKKGN